MSTKSKILATITDYYINSRDFNGCPLYFLEDNFKINEDFIQDLSLLIEDDLIGLITSKEEMNPHVIRTGFVPKEIQIDNLMSINEHQTYCFYPLKKHLEIVVDPQKYKYQFYRLELALGAPQLSYKSFDLSILEMYRNDPRYYYDTNDIGGTISIENEYYESAKMMESDKVLLEHFGYSYDKDFTRGVCVFVCDLANLSEEHQKIWKAKELNDTFKMHPAFLNSQVYGNWPEGVSVFSALTKEMYIINKICKHIEYPNLFKIDFGEYGESKPKMLTFLIRPTLKEFNDFILLFDKILSENINPKFFEKDISLEKENVRKDGKVIVTKKGSIQLLDEWMRKKYRFQDDTGWSIAIKTLKKVRNLRQKPAHIIEADKFDNKYINEQREIILEVYDSINFIRMIMQRHPKLLDVNLDIPDWLEEGKIYKY